MNIQATIIRIIAEELGASEEAISENANLVDDLGADSPHQLEMAMAIEEQFGIEIPDGDLANLHTVGEVISYVVRKTVG